MSQATADAHRAIARAITAAATRSHDAAGGTVESLTEAVMGMTAALCRIADAIQDVASAVQETGSRAHTRPATPDLEGPA